jgi:hypothetical protein
MQTLNHWGNTDRKLYGSPLYSFFLLRPHPIPPTPKWKKTRNQQTETTFKKTKLQTPRGRDGTETWGILGSAFVDVFFVFWWDWMGPKRRDTLEVST